MTVASRCHRTAPQSHDAVVEWHDTMIFGILSHRGPNVKFLRKKDQNAKIIPQEPPVVYNEI
jgi:hypothetical protein